MAVSFEPGRNIAMKIPPHEYDSTLRFYRDVLKFKQIPATGADTTPRFAFGDKVLWLDRVDSVSQAEIWLEVIASDIEAAADYLKTVGCHRRDEIEPLPDGMKAFWIASPANIIHLVCTEDEV